jgi:homoserine kinase
VRITVRVPATSANLGPGFDCFGLALDLCNEVTIDTDAAPGVEWHGQGAGELAIDGTDLVTRTIEHVMSLHDLTRPSFRLVGRNEIPIERGLGSSSAATVAGIVLGSILAGERSPDRAVVFGIAAQIEGHPDNAAPATFGGFTIAVPGGPVRRLDPHPGLVPVALVPAEVRLATPEARAALPEVVAHDDAMFNVAHAALTVHAITSEPSLLAEAMLDRLHQGVRLALLPTVEAMFDSIRAQGFAVCVSGSGPTLLAFEGHERRLPVLDEGWSMLRPGVRSSGFEVLGP